MLTGYIAYCLAESFEISGILTLFVTAVTLAHYSWHSLSKASKLASRIAFVSISDAVEGFAFAYVGLSMWDSTKGPINISFALYMLSAVITSRLVTVVGLGSFRNCFRRDDRLSLYEQLAFMLGGVVRGCLCWAQVLKIGNDEMLLVQTTLVIVLVTTVSCGLVLPVLIPPLTNWIKTEKIENHTKAIEMQSTRESPAPSGQRKESIDSTYSMHVEESDDEEKVNLRTPVDEQSGPHGVSFATRNEDHKYVIKTAGKYSLLFVLWIRFDESFMKPMFGGSAIDVKKAQLLQMTRDLKAYEMFSPIPKLYYETNADPEEDEDMYLFRDLSESVNDSLFDRSEDTFSRLEVLSSPYHAVSSPPDRKSSEEEADPLMPSARTYKSYQTTDDNP